MRTKYLVLSLSVIAAACGSGPAPTKDPPTDLTPCPDCGGTVKTPALPQGLVQGLTINEIAFFQALKVPVMKDGQKADRNKMPLVPKRDAFVRLYVTADGQKAVTPRVKLITRTPNGYVSRIFSGDLAVVKAGTSTEEVLESTINFTLPGELLTPDTSFSLALTTGDGGQAAKANDPARWPQDGSVSGLDVGKGGGGALMRVMLVPVQYNTDGSGRVPDTSDEQLAMYRDVLYRIYPAGQVEITVHDPFPWNQSIQGNFTGFDKILNAIRDLRGQDSPDPDIYYYGFFMPTASFGQFCGGGCITGLSPIGSPYSVGIGFPDPGSAWTAAHEIGHAHGLQHAPCGGAGGPDPMFPYKDGGIGVWGFDQIDKRLRDPTGMTNGGKYKDIMGYCQPSWISDYHYQHLADRVFSDNGYLKDYHPGPGDSVRSHAAMFRAEIGPDSTLSIPQEPPQFAWPERGEPREIDVGGVKEVGYWFPYDHMPGGVLMVPETVRAASRKVAVRVKI
jgi:hypothetical protein